MSRSERADRAVVVVDIGAPQPYAFDPVRVEVVRRALATGDYALDGYESLVVIERKSLDDYIASVLFTRGRFLRELQVLAACDLPCIVVEASFEDIAAHRYRARVHPNAVFSATVDLMVNYNLPVAFCGDRQQACQFAEELLLRAHRKIVELSDAAEATLS